LSGLAVFVFSQLSYATEEKLVPEDHPTFSKTIDVPSHDSMISGFRGVTHEVFYVSAFLNGSTSYVMVFEDSDLHIDTVNLTDPEDRFTLGVPSRTGMGYQFPFTTTVEGWYAFSVTGHYIISVGAPRYDLPPSPSNVPIPGNFYGEENVLDKTVNVAIFELASKYENTPSLLMPLGAFLSATGTLSILISILKLNKAEPQ